jgi:hypothetical protein
MKRFVLWSTALLVLGVPAALVAAAWLALDDRPAVVRKAELTPAQVARARALASAHDPRKTPPGALRSVTLSAEDVELAANYLVASHGGGAKVALQPGAAALWVTARAPANPFGHYVNAEAVLHETSGLPRFDRLSIGRLPVPAPIADRLLAHALERLSAASGGIKPADLVDSVRIDGGQMQIVYRWREDVPERLRAALLPPADQDRLQAHQQRLVQLTADARLPRQISLRMLLEPMLQFAASRSAASDPVAENRAALLVLAFYVNGRGLTAVVPQARAWPQPAPRKITLNGRHDLAQHFSVSAALAASAGSPLADAVGFYKEVEDARAGSGFSFADLAADRAGSVFGARATRSAEGARQLQQRLRDAVVESDFMPPIDGLPESMNDDEFKRRFGAVGQPAYRHMEAEVERRIAALALYR